MSARMQSRNTSSSPSAAIARGRERVQRQLSGVTGLVAPSIHELPWLGRAGRDAAVPGGRISVQSPSAEGAAGSGETSQVRLMPPFRAKPYPAPGFSIEAVQTPARVNVTCVTPLGEEAASTS
jgi:hypothetical protein